MIKTFAQVAKEKGITRQAVYYSKHLYDVVELPLFVEYNSKKECVGKMKFVIEKANK